MSRKDEYERKTWELLKPVASEMGLIPVDAEFVKEGGEYFLRIYIDKEGGVGINDCESLSRRIDPLLDKENFITDPYTLEVSSPGLGRVLRRPHDFEYAVGREVDVKLYHAVGKLKEFTGILLDSDDQKVTIRPDNSGEDLTIEKKDIARVRLTFDL